jgi:hypothetical protein
VSERERQYEDGSDPEVLDIISVPVIESVPEGFQTENWLLDPDYYWERVDRADWQDLDSLESPVAPLWINGYETYHGRNNRVPADQAARLSDSLRLIRVDTLRLQVHAPGADFGDPKRVVAGSFTYAGEHYALRVTDPVYERRFLAQPDGRYDLGESFLAVSLGEVYDGYAYKLIAAVLERERVEGGGEQ